MNKITQLLSLAILSSNCFAQVQKNVIVEHFTNTVCSVCNSKNPQLNQNLSNHPEVLRISYHPSSPYSSCLLNQHNNSGNDDRTNQYSIYGATPRIVIQGQVQNPNVSFSSTTLFNAFQNQTTPIHIGVSINELTADSIDVNVTINSVADISMIDSNPILYIALAEDTIFYNAPNDEQEHKNVFRRSLNGSQGNMITIPSNGNSVSFSYRTEKDNEWDMNRIFAFAILQDGSNDEVIQVGSSTNIFDNISSITQESSDVSYTWNGTEIRILNNLHKSFSYKIYSVDGKLISTSTVTNSVIDLSDIKTGIYLLRLNSTQSFKPIKSYKL